VKRPPEQILLLGDDAAAARWLPLVRHKVEMLRRRLGAKRLLVEKLRIPAGWAVIKVTRARSKLIIYADPIGVSYEFFTSEALRRANIEYFGGTPSFDGFSCGRGSFHVFRGENVVSAPLVDYSSTGTPAPDGPDGEPLWPTRSCNRNAGGAGEMKTRSPFWTDQATYRHTAQANRNGTFALVGWNSLPGSVPVGNWSRVNYGLAEGGRLSYSTEYHPVVVYNAKSFSPVHVGIPADLWPPGSSNDAPAAAATYTSDGGYGFVIMTTSQGLLYVWRLKQYETFVIQSADYVKVELPSPTWALLEKGVGSFRSDARRFASIPMATSQSPPTADGEISYSAFSCVGNSFGRFAPDSPVADLNEPHFERAPGLVEYSIYVELTLHDGIEGIEVSVNRIYDEWVETSGRYIVGADYLYADARLPHPEGTLVMVDMEVYRTSDALGQPNSGLLYEPPGGVTPQVPDHVDTTLRSFYKISARDGGAWVELHRIPTLFDADMAYVTETRSIQCQSGGPLRWFQADSLRVGTTYTYFGALMALDLKSLSWATYGHMPSAAGTAAPYLSGIEVVAYGEVVHQEFDAGFAAPEWSPGDMVECETEYREIWAVVHHETRIPFRWMAFSTHPKGHWSFASQPMQVWQESPWASIPKQVDIINVRQGGKDVRFTHKDLYNAAFGDSRDYNYYVTDEPGGTFRTFGLFRDG